MEATPKQAEPFPNRCAIYLNIFFSSLDNPPAVYHMPKQRDPENDCHVLFHLSVSGPLMGSSLIYSANQNLLIPFLRPKEI